MNAACILRVLRVWAIATVVLCSLDLAEAPGQGGKSRDSGFAPGDSVGVRQGNKWQAGEVVETTRGGLVKVRVTGTPRSRVVTVPKRLVRRADVAAAAAAANSPENDKVTAEIKRFFASLVLPKD